MRSDFRIRRLSEIPRNSASRMSASSIDTNPRMIAKMLCNAQSGSISGIVQSSTISVTLPKQSMLRNLAYPLCLKGKHCIAQVVLRLFGCIRSNAESESLAKPSQIAQLQLGDGFRRVASCFRLWLGGFDSSDERFRVHCAARRMWKGSDPFPL